MVSKAIRFFLQIKDKDGFFLQDNPEQGVLYVVRGLLNVITELPWDATNDTRMLIFMNVLVMLSASCQETFIYHIDKGKGLLRLAANQVYIYYVKLPHIILYPVF